MHRTDDIPAFQSYASSETELVLSDFSWLLSQMPTRGEGHEMMLRKQPPASSRELGRYSVSGRCDDTFCIGPCSLLHIVLFHVGFCCLEGSPSTSNSEQCNTLPPSPQQSEALTHFPQCLAVVSRRTLQPTVLAIQLVTVPHGHCVICLLHTVA